MQERHSLACVLLAAIATGCGFDPSVVEACESSIGAHNELACVGTATFRNAQDECAALERTREEILADTMTPRAAKACAQDFACTSEDLAAFYKCQESTWSCDENGIAGSAGSCDDHLPNG